MNNDLEQRVRQLEIANQRLRRLAVATLAIGGIALFMGQTFSPADDVQAGDEPVDGAEVPEELSTRRLRIVDENGLARIDCSVLGDMPTMRFLDADGRATVSIFAKPDSPSLEMTDKEGRTRISLGGSPSGPGMKYLGGDGRPDMILGGTDDGPGLILFDANRPRVLVGVKNNQPVMAVLNSDSNLSFEQPRPQAVPD